MPLNRHGVTAHGGKVVIVMPIRAGLTSRETLEFAAWLVVMAEINALTTQTEAEREPAIADDALAALAPIVADIKKG